MIRVGIIGLGIVGLGTYRILKEHHGLIKERTGLDIRVVRIADIDLERDRGIRLPEGLLTKDAFDIINDEGIDIVVELIGGTTHAYDYIVAAIKKKKWVVTANKALLAEKGDAIFRLIEQERCEIGFEASVCGGIPVIRAIREGLIANRINSILGILNGTSNYILTKMTEDGVSFQEAIAEAQAAGFAEQDPTLDVEGVDAAHKLSILIRLAFGSSVSMKDIMTRGISTIEPIDIEFAREFGYKIKLLSLAKEEGGDIEARVEPVMIPANHPMSSVTGVYNAVYIVADRTGPNLYSGKGAGGEPTGSSVVSDIVDMAFRKAIGSPKMAVPVYTKGKRIRNGDDSSAPFYMRFMAEDRPGVLSNISGILAEHNISIAAVIQKERREKGYVPIVMLTHEAREGGLKKAKEEIDRLPFIYGKPVHIRIEESVV